MTPPLDRQRPLVEKTSLVARESRKEKSQDDACAVIVDESIRSAVVTQSLLTLSLTTERLARQVGAARAWPSESTDVSTARACFISPPCGLAEDGAGTE